MAQKWANKNDRKAINLSNLSWDTPFNVVFRVLIASLLLTFKFILKPLILNTRKF